MTRNAATPCWDPSTLPTWDPSMSDPIEESDVTDATPITRKARVGAYVRTPCAHTVITWEYGRIFGWDADGDPIVRMASEYEDVLDASEVFKADKAEFADPIGTLARPVHVVRCAVPIPHSLGEFR